jgi:hypothetical protein
VKLISDASTQRTPLILLEGSQSIFHQVAHDGIGLHNVLIKESSAGKATTNALASSDMRVLKTK